MEERYQKLQAIRDKSPILMTENMFGGIHDQNKLIKYFADFISDMELNQGGQISTTTINVTSFLYYLEEKLGADSSEFKEIKGKFEEFIQQGKINDDVANVAEHTLSNFAIALKEAGVLDSDKSPTESYREALKTLGKAGSSLNTSRVNTVQRSHSSGSSSNGAKNGAGTTATNPKNKGRGESKLETKDEENLSGESKIEISSENNVEGESQTGLHNRGQTIEKKHSDVDSDEEGDKDIDQPAVQASKAPAAAIQDDFQGEKGEGGPVRASGGPRMAKPAELNGTGTPSNYTEGGTKTSSNVGGTQALAGTLPVLGKSRRIVPLAKTGTSKAEPTLRKREDSINRTDGSRPEKDSQQLANNFRQRPAPQERRGRKKKKGSLVKKVIYGATGTGAIAGGGVIDSFAQSIFSTDANLIFDLITSFLS
jgi:hypothetical protein